MKKSLLALAALSAFAGVASAQSSVTMFGIVDAAWTRLSGGGRSFTGITNSNYNSSRFGVRGVEDLGGGLRASFWLEAQLFNDNGKGESAATDLNFRRRSTVSLLGGFGEIRLGRDYSPTFWNTTIFDPFGTNGVGSSNTPGMAGGIGANGFNAVRADNSVSYFTPAMGGLSLQVMKAFGEQASNTGAAKKTNDYFGFRVAYAAGPLSAAFAYGKTEGATDAADVKYTNFGGQYTFGTITPVLLWAQEKVGAGAKVNALQLGLLVSVGSGTIRASWGDYDQKGGTAAVNANDWTKLAIGYLHNMSKRTTVYGSYARVSNDGTQTRAPGANGLGPVSAAAGGNATGFEFGVRHAF